MVRLEQLREIGEYLFLTFPLRRLLLLILVVLSVAPGTFLYLLPVSIRLAYAYIYVAIMSVSAHCLYGTFLGPVKMALASVLLRGKYPPREYSAPGIKRLLRRMGIKKQVRVYLTSNPWITSPFTNALTCKIYLPTSWLTKFPRTEILATVGHELGHVKSRRRFGLELSAALGIVLVASLALSLRTAPIFVEIFELAFAMLLMTKVSWRNERRADLEGAKATDPEGLISVFEQLKVEYKRDDGSETHPPLSDRIKRLMNLLDQDQ